MTERLQSMTTLPREDAWIAIWGKNGETHRGGPIYGWLLAQFREGKFWDVMQHEIPSGAIGYIDLPEIDNEH